MVGIVVVDRDRRALPRYGPAKNVFAFKSAIRRLKPSPESLPTTGPFIHPIHHKSIESHHRNPISTTLNPTTGPNRPRRSISLFLQLRALPRHAAMRTARPRRGSGPGSALAGPLLLLSLVSLQTPPAWGFSSLCRSSYAGKRGLKRNLRRGFPDRASKSTRGPGLGGGFGLT